MLKPPERYSLGLKLMKKREGRSKSLPPSITAEDMTPSSTNNIGSTMFRVGTRFMKADTKLKYSKKLNTNNTLKMLSTVNTGNRGNNKKQLNYLKPNFKLGNIAPYDIYSNRHFSSTPLGNFTYMP